MPRGEDAFTGLELVVLIAVLAGVSAFLLIPLMGGGPSPWVRTFPEGPVAESVYQSGDHLQPVGNIFGRISKNTDSTISQHRLRKVWKVSLILRYRNATDE